MHVRPGARWQEPLASGYAALVRILLPLVLTAWRAMAAASQHLYNVVLLTQLLPRKRKCVHLALIGPWLRLAVLQEGDEVPWLQKALGEAAGRVAQINLCHRRAS
jgi:hypothetical protein